MLTIEQTMYVFRHKPLTMEFFAGTRGITADSRGVFMKKFYIWHNTRGKSDQYFVVNRDTDIMLFGIPKFIGRLICR